MASCKYKHYPVEKARDESMKGQRRKFRVTTINWTYATEKGGQNHSKVHKNEYVWTLRYLIKWIRETEEVAEDIIAIEAVE